MASYELESIYSFFSSSLDGFEGFLSIEFPVVLALKSFSFDWSSFFIAFKVTLLFYNCDFMSVLGKL